MLSDTLDQLVNGVRVRCPRDGSEVVCAPLTLAVAMEIEGLWAQRDDPARSPEERGQVRLRITRRFAELYPELTGKIGAGDVDGLLVGFFWGTTGAAVVRPTPPAAPSTGTPPGETIPPSGASSPIP